jgi:hypothetical protein
MKQSGSWKEKNRAADLRRSWGEACASAVGQGREMDEAGSVRRMCMPQGRMGSCRRAAAGLWRRQSVHLILGIDIGALLYQKLSRSRLVELCGVVQRSTPLRSPGAVGGRNCTGRGGGSR